MQEIMIEGQLKDRERRPSEFMTLMDCVSVDIEDGEFDRELRVLSAISIIVRSHHIPDNSKSKLTNL